MDKIKIVNAKDMGMTLAKISEISQITRIEQDLIYRSVAHICNAIKKGNFLLAVDDVDTIRGFIEQSKISGLWYGLFMLYVYPQYRGGGIGTKNLLSHAVNSIKEGNIYAATRKKSIQKALEKMGFSTVNLRKIPLAVLIRILINFYRHPQSLLKLWKMRDKGFIYLIKQT